MRMKSGVSDPAGASCTGHAGQGRDDRTARTKVGDPTLVCVVLEERPDSPAGDRRYHYGASGMPSRPGPAFPWEQGVFKPQCSVAG